MTGSDHQPEHDYFELMAEQARTHWWYEARRALVADVIERRASGAVIIDVGCGTGDNLSMLDDFAGRPTLGFELSQYAAGWAPATDGGHSRVGVAYAEHLPLANAVADVLTSMDVIEHVDDDVQVLREYARVLRPGGLLLVTVPAYPSLWSAHDDWAAHRRRYRRTQLETAIRAGGFDVARSTYFNSFLVPPAYLLRRTPLRHLVRGAQDEVGASSPILSRVMRRLASLERRWARRHRVPAGLSILVLAHRRP